MKNLFSLLILVLLFVTQVIAEPVQYRKKNTATRFCGTLLDITTARQIGVASTGITCVFTTYTDAADESGMNNFATPEAVIGTGGAFCQPVTAGEINIDGYLRAYCQSPGIANSASYEITLTTIKTDIADNGIGPLTQTFDGQSLAEGTKTLDLEANEVSADGQFVGDKIALFSAAGAYYGSSCITASTNTSERVTTKEDLSSLHTVGDYYVIRPDAGCKLDLVAAQLTTPPTVGAETLIDKITTIYQRLVYKLDDNRNTNRRNWYNGAGSSVIGHQNLSNSGNINSTGALIP